MKGRILICDDDLIIRLDIKQILEQSDYEVAAEASDGFRTLPKTLFRSSHYGY